MKEKTGRAFIKNKIKGATLPIVLLVLGGLLVISIILIQLTGLELRITGNERIYRESFVLAESGARYVAENLDLILDMTSGGIEEDCAKPPCNYLIYDEKNNKQVYDIINTEIKDPDKSAQIKIRFNRKGSPPKNTGNSAARFYAKFYDISSTVNNTTVEMGFSKTYPDLNNK